MLHYRLLVLVEKTHDSQTLVLALFFLNQFDFKIEEVHLLEQVLDILVLDVEVGVETHGFRS